MSRRDPRYLTLRANGVSLILAIAEHSAPRILHWGTDLGELTEPDCAALDAATIPGHAAGMPEAGIVTSMLPVPSDGWLWTPGITGHRDGVLLSPAFTDASADVTRPSNDPVIAHRVQIRAHDPAAQSRLDIELEMLHSGAFRTRATIRNDAQSTLDLNSLDISLPVPARASEIADMAGRHLRERDLQRSPFTIGTHLRESRKSSGHEASIVLGAGTEGFGWRTGEVWLIHSAWSGNTRVLAERTNIGTSTLSAGELLLPGEIRLRGGDKYTSPWLYATYGCGLDDAAARFHDFLRSRPEHPPSPRPVTLNVWEAVYFDHDLDRLQHLATLAADIGVERFVLDDGWFRNRRDDTSGLGDWYVDDVVWPDGLHPLTKVVTDLGMQFGLWFEPEMVNEDSDLARAHPDWIMASGERLPRRQRHQQALNLTIPDAYDHIRSRILHLLGEYPISYIKWDHNRALTEPCDRTSGRPIAHLQVEALYRLLDEIRAAHPDLEIESCASGGGRIDLGILARTDRVWASDCIDPLERQRIEAGTSLLLPPELVGSHVASPLSHTTGRQHSLSFRAGTALFSHMGIEWDLAAASPAERAELAEWIALHKHHRPLLHNGRTVHRDPAGDGLWVHGVIARDGREALIAVVATETSPTWPGPPVTLPGLDPTIRYRVTPISPRGTSNGTGDAAHSLPSWWHGDTVVPGAALQQVGVQVPTLKPENLALLHLVST